MAKDRETIDISHHPDLLLRVEEIRRRSASAVLTNGDEDVAVVTLLAAGTKRSRKAAPTRKKSAADMEAFFASFGGWKDVDTDRLKADISESRQRSTKPRPAL